MRFLLPLALIACAGESTDEPTDMPSSMTPEPTMTPSPPTEVPDDCPRPGRGMIEVTVVGADPTVTDMDELSIVFFPTTSSPPSYFTQVPGADFTMLPAVAIDNNVPAQDWPMVSACMDAGADTLSTCEGPDDVLIITMAGIPVEAGRVTQFEVDYAASTIGPATVVDARADCP